MDTNLYMTVLKPGDEIRQIQMTHFGHKSVHDSVLQPGDEIRQIQMTHFVIHFNSLLTETRKLSVMIGSLLYVLVSFERHSEPTKERYTSL